MNKFLTKIAGVVASIAMVIGVGVGVANKQAKGAYAAGIPNTYSLVTTSSLSSLNTSDKVVIVANVSGNATGVTGYSGCRRHCFGRPIFSRQESPEKTGGTAGADGSQQTDCHYADH